MSQIGEEVAAVQKFMEEESLCKVDDKEKYDLECRIGKKGSPGELDVPTAERLYQNMKDAQVSLPSPPDKIDGDWDLYKCSPSSFPFQSHHLIPKMHLPKHPVCVWLAKAKANKQWKLKGSTDYDTDDARNGMPLPFASTTHQWKNTSNADVKTELCNKMMELTKKQLHQGSHTYEDYGEEESLHEKEGKGYLGAVDELLKMVNGQTLMHVMTCPHCKKSAKAPIEVRPLERVVLAIHQVSGQLKSIITLNKRFVSKRAADYFG